MLILILKDYMQRIFYLSFLLSNWASIFISALPSSYFLFNLAFSFSSASLIASNWFPAMACTSQIFFAALFKLNAHKEAKHQSAGVTPLLFYLTGCVETSISCETSKCFQTEPCHSDSSECNAEMWAVRFSLSPRGDAPFYILQENLCIYQVLWQCCATCTKAKTMCGRTVKCKEQYKMVVQLERDCSEKVE